MNNQVTSWNRVSQFSCCEIDAVLMGCAALLLSAWCLTGSADAAGFDNGPREEHIPVLCVTMEEAPTGKVIRGKVIFIYGAIYDAR